MNDREMEENTREWLSSDYTDPADIDNPDICWDVTPGRLQALLRRITEEEKRADKAEKKVSLLSDQVHRLFDHIIKLGNQLSDLLTGTTKVLDEESERLFGDN